MFWQKIPKNKSQKTNNEQYQSFKYETDYFDFSMIEEIIFSIERFRYTPVLNFSFLYLNLFVICILRFVISCLVLAPPG
jgi:hypothetical protein